MEMTFLQWEEIKKKVRYDFNIADISYDTWIKDLKLHSILEDCATILIPIEQAHAKNYIENKYKNYFVKVMEQMLGKTYWLEFVVESEMDRLSEDIKHENYNDKDTQEKWKTVRKKMSKIEKALHKAQKELSELEEALEVF